MSLAVSMMRRLREEGVQGFHLCTLNLEKSVKRVLEQLDWVTPASIANSTARRLVRPVLSSTWLLIRCSIRMETCRLAHSPLCRKR